MLAKETADRSQDIPQETEVLIVGGGPVGLSAAVELGRRGVQCLIVEPRLLVSQLRLRDDAEVAPLIEAAAAHGVPLTVLELRGEEIEERYGASLVLVRPDQHVAWRGASVDRPTAEAVIDQVRGI